MCDGFQLIESKLKHSALGWETIFIPQTNWCNKLLCIFEYTALEEITPTNE